MKNLITRFLKEEDGATMVEYAILVALISVVAIVIIASVGTKVNSAFTEVDTQLGTASAGGGGGGTP